MTYKTKELAQLLDVTVRTVHRLLVVWQDEGLIRAIGEERPAGKGRPRQIFELTFLSDIVRSASGIRLDGPMVSPGSYE